MAMRARWRIVWGLKFGERVLAFLRAQKTLRAQVAAHPAPVNPHTTYSG